MQKSKREPKSINSLAELRDQLKRQARSFKAGVKDEWRRIESEWRVLQRRILPARWATEKSASDVRAASEHLLKTVKRGYERIKHSLVS